MVNVCPKVKVLQQSSIQVTHNTISVDGWSIQYSCGHYYDSYLTINSPRDGRSQGLCGYYGKQGAGEDRKNGNFLSSSGSRGKSSMTSRAFFNGPLTIKTGESVFQLPWIFKASSQW